MNESEIQEQLERLSTALEGIQRAELSALDNPEVEEYLSVAWKEVMRVKAWFEIKSRLGKGVRE